LPQCTTSADSAFIDYFEFSILYYRTRIEGYQYSAEHGGSFIINYARPTDNTQTEFSVNQIGLHSRGSGYSIENPYYYPAETDVPADSTGYPVEPPAYVREENASTVADTRLADFLANNQELADMAANADSAILVPVLEDYANNRERLAAIDAYVAALAEYYAWLLAKYGEDVLVWYRDYGVPQVKQRQMEVVDSLLDIESAIDTPFEGFRFGALMRESYRKGDATILANRVGKRDASLIGLLSDRRNWFISWKGQIGK